MSSVRMDLDLAAQLNVEAPADRVGRALLAVQYAADATLAEARVEAEHIRAEARADAERIRARARAEVVDLEQLVGGLRNQIEALSNKVVATTRVRVQSASQSIALEAPAAAAVPVAVAPPVATAEAVEPAAHPKERAPDAVAPAQTSPGLPGLRQWWAAVPLEAILPILAIVAVLLVMLALMG